MCYMRLTVHGFFMTKQAWIVKYMKAVLTIWLVIAKKKDMQVIQMLLIVQVPLTLTDNTTPREMDAM